MNVHTDIFRKSVITACRDAVLERDHGCDFSVDVCLLPHVHFGPNRDAENKTFELELFFQTKNWSGNTSSEKSTRPVSLTPAFEHLVPTLHREASGLLRHNRACCQPG